MDLLSKLVEKWRESAREYERLAEVTEAHSPECLVGQWDAALESWRRMNGE